MQTAESEEADGNNDLREQEKSSTPTISLPVDDKSRFLKKRNKKNFSNSYHPSHDPTSVAEIPDGAQGNSVDDDDRDAPLVWPAEREVADEDIRRLKQELSHLPFDTVLRILSMNSYDIDATIEKGKQMIKPDLVPHYLKDYFVANIAIERCANPTRTSLFKQFYFAKHLRKVADTQTLVDFYYHEKNKIDGNWRLDQLEAPLTTEEKEDLEDRMKQNNISIIIGDPSISSKRRAKKAAATRRAKQLMKETNGDGSQGKETDSDSISVSSTEAPSSSEVKPLSAPSPPSSTLGPFRNRELPPINKFSTISNASNGVPKTNRRKNNIESKPIGPRRSYPGRLRKPPTFFE